MHLIWLFCKSEYFYLRGLTLICPTEQSVQLSAIRGVEQLSAVYGLVVGSPLGGCGALPEPPMRAFTRSRNCWNVT